jgi:hypothetical protein
MGPPFLPPLVPIMSVSLSSVRLSVTAARGLGVAGLSLAGPVVPSGCGVRTGFSGSSSAFLLRLLGVLASPGFRLRAR